MSLISLVLSTAFAAEPLTLTVPALGVTIVAKDNCDFTVVGTVPSRKAGELATALADAKTRCLESQARVAEQARRDAVATTRAPGEAKLMGDAGMAVATGKDVKVIVTDERLTVESGQHLQWQAYGQALATNPGALGVGGVYDPRFVQPYVLDQGRAGFMAHPAVPGGAMAASAAAPAKCGTAQECQKAIDQLQALAAADAEK